MRHLSRRGTKSRARAPPAQPESRQERERRTKERFLGSAWLRRVVNAYVLDDEWHRVGFVWDGSDRILYVDGVEVAKDTQAGLAGAGGGLQIGAGSRLAPGTLWSGLIDDMRVYERAVKP